MDMLSLASHLEKTLSDSPVVYLKLDPEISDFTKLTSSVLSICGRTSTTEIPLNDRRLPSVVQLLSRRVWAKNCSVLSWDIKRLASYLKFHLPKSTVYDGSIIDLKYSEAFCGIHNPKPKNLKEALTRCKTFAKNPDWQNVYRKIYLPLALQVLPDMETKGVLGKNLFYTSYDIEGQINGRLSCQCPAANFINPHTMDAVLREQLHMPEQVFVEFDFSHMEVNVLAGLTGDETLKQLMDQDVYRGIYEILTGEPCQTPEQRSFIKGIFLPVLFGMQPTAENLYDKIHEKFPTATGWMLDKELETSGKAVNHFGKIRDFTNVSHYKRRSFEVQSAAAIICLEKLVELHKSLGEHLLFHIHDAYILSCPVSKLKSVVKTAREILEGGEWNLKTSCSVGVKLSEMKRI